MGYIVIPDTAIRAVNRGKQENESSNIIYLDKSGRGHSIDFDVCATNFKAEHGTSSGNCIGEQKMDEYYFIFYTSGIKTKIVFKKMYVGNLFRYHRLNGSKANRFLALQNLINETRYTTYDLSKRGENMDCILPEEQLIEYAKPYLKAKGFKKKNKRWTKDIGEFTLCFYIQGSCYSKEDYYIRPGVFVNSLLPTDLVYGHWETQIEQTTPEKVLHDFEQWCEEWTNKALIKDRLVGFMEWEERNPLEKRRAKLVDYNADPVPADEFFMVDLKTKKYILDNF